MAALVLSVELLPMNTVWPSCGALSAVCTPMKPLPPGLFSTVTGWPASSPMLLAKSRAVMSVPLPGGNGTMKRIGRDGKAGVCANDGMPARPASCSQRRRWVVTLPARAGRVGVGGGGGGGAGWLAGRAPLRVLRSSLAGDGAARFEPGDVCLAQPRLAQDFAAVLPDRGRLAVDRGGGGRRGGRV